MSRVCVKNIPRYVTDEKLREHFAARGEVTDAKVINTRDGRSRQFGFVGFRTEDEASAAAKYFHRTYFDNSRISCEVAYGIGDPNLPRPWSRHSQGSSAYEKIHETTQPSSSGSMPPTQLQKEPGKLLSGAQENDPRLAEFLEVMQPRSKSKLWANDTAAGQETSKRLGRSIVKVEASTVPAVLRKVPIGKGESTERLTRLHVRYEDESDDEPDDAVPDLRFEESDKAEANEAEHIKEDDEVLKDDSVSDLAYLRSRMKDDWSDKDGDEIMDSSTSSQSLSGNDILVKEGEDQDECEESVDLHVGPSGRFVKEEGGDKSEEANKFEAVGTDERLTELENEDKELAVFQDQEGVSETGRLFIRNLPYTASEGDIRELFSKYGDLSQVHLVLDRDTKRSKGLAFVLYMFPEAAVRALEELDKTIFQGRLLHILPAKRPMPVPEKEQTAAGTKASKFAQKKDEGRKAAESGGNTTAWNAFFMNPDTVAESVAQQYGLSKGDFLDPEAEDLAVRLALGETHIIAETKRALSREGINVKVMEKLATAGEKDVKRSNQVILVKNLPFATTQGELVKIFNNFGTLGRIVLPPTKTLALVEFLEAADAQKAFRGLAYKRFKHVPLYLEWAPDEILVQQNEENPRGSLVAVEQAKHVTEEQLAPADIESDLDHAQARSVFVKNLNFSTSEASLRKHIRQFVQGNAAIRSVKINMKPSKIGKPLSMGFGFAEFDTIDTAKEVCRLLQGTVLDGHALMVQLSHRSNPKGQAKSSNERPAKGNKKASSTKVIIRNVAFEATKKDLRQLVSPFGQIKSLRLPKKFDGNHRGFAFVEFVTRQEAQNAFDALQSTHLYGRHLVLEHAKEGETLEDLRAKTLKQMLENESGEKNVRPSKKRRVLDDGAISFERLVS